MSLLAPSRPTPASRNFSRRGSLPGFVSLVAVAVAVLRLAYVPGPLRADEGGFLVVSRAWELHGPTLYGHYFVDRPPLLLAVFRLASLVSWDGFVRVLTIPSAVLFVVAAAGAARVVAGRRGARWAAVVAGALAVTPAVGAQEANGEIFAVPWVMVAVWCTLAAVRRPRVHLAVGAGAAAAVAVMVKQSFGDGVVFALVLLAASLVQGRLPLRDAARVALGGAVGGLVVLLPFLAYAEVAGPGVGEAVFTLLGFRGEALRVIADQSAVAPVGRAGYLAGMAVISGIVPLGAVLARAARGRRLSPVSWAVGLTAATETAAIVLGGSYWSHYLIQLAPMVALGAGIAGPRVRAVRLVASVTVAAAALFSVGVDLAGAQEAPPDGRAAGAWVRAASSPHDSLVVLYGHAEVQEASGLPSPYPYLWSLPARTLDPRLRLLRATLAGPTAPTWVVVWDSLNPWRIDAHRRTALTLAAHYRLVATVCEHAVWLRDGAPRSLPALPTRC